MIDFAGDEGTSSLQNNDADGTTQININEIIVQEDVNIVRRRRCKQVYKIRRL
jgi:hypothetical protein